MKLNVSVDDAVAELIRQRARETGKTMSAYLSDLVRTEASQQRDELAEEGYRWLSSLNDDFAESAMATAAVDWPTPEEVTRARTARRRRTP